MAGNIAEYNSPIDKLTPSETGAETLARMGRIEAENYDQAGRAYGETIKTIGQDVETHQSLAEISQGSAALAVMHNNLSTSWNQLAQNSDPNDSSIQQKFMDQANDQLGQWQGSFGTKKGQDFAMNAADNMRNHLWESTSADMSNRAGVAVVNNMKTTLQGWSGSAYQDPTTIPHALNQIDATVAAQKDAVKGMLTVTQADRIDTLAANMKNDVVKSGIKGLADSDNPQAAIKMLDNGAFNGYLSDGEIQQMRDYATVQQHGKDLDKQNTAKADKLKQVAAADQANGQFLGALTQGKIPSATEIISNPSMTNAQKSQWIAKGNGILSQSTDQLHTAALGNNFAGVSSAIYSGQPLTTDGLLGGIRRGELSPAGAAQLQKLQAMQKTPEGMSELAAQNSVLQNVQQQLVKGGPYANDPVGQKNYNSFMNSFYSTWDAGIKKGLTPQELSDPSSKNYIGNVAGQFKRSDAQAISDVVHAATQANVPVAASQPKSAAVTKAWVFKDGNLVPAGGQ